MKTNQTKNTIRASGWLTALLLAIVLVLLFHRSFDPQYVHFSNEGPLGQQMQGYAQLPGSFLGYWRDANVIGGSAGAWVPFLSDFFHNTPFFLEIG